MYKVEDEVTKIPIKSQKVIKEKKIVGSRTDSWNREYTPGGGNVKIYNKNLKFQDKRKPFIEAYDTPYTKHQDTIRVHTDIDANEESTIEVITRPFEIEQTSRSITVTREMKKLPTPPSPLPPSPPLPPEPSKVRNVHPLNLFYNISYRLLKNRYNKFKL